MTPLRAPVTRASAACGERRDDGLRLGAGDDRQRQQIALTAAVLVIHFHDRDEDRAARPCG